MIQPDTVPAPVQVTYHVTVERSLRRWLVRGPLGAVLVDAITAPADHPLAFLDEHRRPWLPQAVTMHHAEPVEPGHEPVWCEVLTTCHGGRFSTEAADRVLRRWAEDRVEGDGEDGLADARLRRYLTAVYRAGFQAGAR